MKVPGIGNDPTKTPPVATVRFEAGGEIAGKPAFVKLTNAPGAFVIRVGGTS